MPFHEPSSGAGLRLAVADDGDATSRSGLSNAAPNACVST